MTQAQYDKIDQEKNSIKRGLQDTRITPEEALDALQLNCGFGFARAVALVDEWSKGIYEPYSVWSKTKVGY